MIYQIEQTYSNVKQNRRRMVSEIPINYNVILPSSDHNIQNNQFAIDKKRMSMISYNYNQVETQVNSLKQKSAYMNIDSKLNPVSSRKSFIEVVSNQMKSSNVSRNVSPNNKQNVKNINRNKRQRQSVPLRMKRPKADQIGYGTTSIQVKVRVQNGQSNNAHTCLIGNFKPSSEKNGNLAIKTSIKPHSTFQLQTSNNTLTRMQFEYSGQQND